MTNVVTTLACFGSRSRSLGATLRKIFVEANGGIVFGKPRRGHAATPWTWSLTRDDIDALILCEDLKLTRSGKLTARSLRRVKAVRPPIRFRVF